MKVFLTSMFLLVGIFASAQVVNIPDTAFKAFLVGDISINTNGDTEIQVTEALAVVTLSMSSNSGIIDLTGIRSFANLESLQATNNNFTSIDVSGMQQLEELSLYYNSMLSQINVSGCINLKSLFAPGCNLSTLNVSDCIKLESIVCSGSHLSTLDVSQCTELKYLDCDDNNLNNITLGVLDSLSMLYVSGNAFTSLDLRNCPNLTSVSCQNISTLISFNASGLRKLTSVYFTPISGSSFDMNLSGCSSLINAGLNLPLTNLDVSGCTSLQSLETGGAPAALLNNLDLSSCVSLTSLQVINAVPIDINLKNGSMLTSFNFHDYGQQDTIFHICADEFEVDALLSFFSNNPGLQPAFISSYCSFFPGGHYNTIKGKVRLDGNSNGCDVPDAGMASVPIRMTDTSGNSVVRYTVFNGDYAHYPYSGNFTITPYFPYPYFNITPGSANIAFDTANNLIDSANFCIAASGLHNDLEISFLPLTASRPGFNAGYQLVYKNRGTTTLSGVVQLNFDNSKMNFVSASTNVSSQTPGQLIWNYTNLQPFQNKIIDITFSLLPPPINNINDTLIYLATVNPTTGDETPLDNSFILPQRIVGSSDPNDKLCLEGDKIAFADIDKPLHYIIHFQNLGTDTAFNIVVADTLGNKLDWNSFEFISSSHTCDVQQRNGKMEFFFENISLPHSSINEPASHGFVSFKIRPKSDVIIGDSLNNRAAIYFDFNLPVITNTATTIVSPVGPVPIRLEYFSAAAKGNTNILNWKAACSDETSNFDIERSGDGIHFSKIGNITATDSRCRLPFTFADEQPLTGKNYYRLKITDNDGIYLYSKVLVVGNNKQGIEITTITSSQHNSIAYLNSAKQQPGDFKIVAGDGKIIYSSSKIIPAGNSQIELPLKNIPNGIYTLIVNTENGMVSRRFVR